MKIIIKLIAIQVIQTAILFAILIFAGRVGLGLPLLEAALRGETVADKVRAILPMSVTLGLFFTLLVLGLEFPVFQPAMLKELGDTAAALNLQSQPAVWKGFLASFYGDIAEEIQLRLFLMSFFGWLYWKHGLESAMISHFSADIVLHVLLAL